MKDFHHFGLNLTKISKIGRKFWTSLIPWGENFNTLVTFSSPAGEIDWVFNCTYHLSNSSWSFSVFQISHVLDTWHFYTPHNLSLKVEFHKLDDAKKNFTIQRVPSILGGGHFDQSKNPSTGWPHLQRVQKFSIYIKNWWDLDFSYIHKKLSADVLARSNIVSSTFFNQPSSGLINPQSLSTLNFGEPLSTLN